MGRSENPLISAAIFFNNEFMGFQWNFMGFEIAIVGKHHLYKVKYGLW